MRARLLFGAAGAALLALAAPQARAQDDDPPADASTRARLTDSVSGEIGPAGDGDWYRLRVEAGMRYQINLDAVAAEGEEGGLDPMLAVYDRDGNQLAFNDDSGSLNSALIYVPTASGEVFVEARGFGDESVGRYQLRVASSVAPPDDAGNDRTTRARLADGQSVSGSLEVEGDVDWYRLSVRAGRIYHMALNSAEGDGALGDPLLRVYDSNGSEIASNDDSDGSLNSALDYVPTRNETVFVAAGGYGDAQMGNYTLSVAGQVLPEDDASGATNTRGRLEVGGEVQSTLGFPSDRDWYRIRLTEGETYRFALSGAGDDAIGDPLLKLYDARGEELSSDDDSGEGLNSYLEFTAPATGNFFLEARGFSDEATGGYTLSARAGDIPADASTDVSLSADGDYRDGVLATAGDRDWYRVTMAEGASMRVGLNGGDGAGALGDPYLAVHGPDGAEIATDDDGGEGLNSWLEFTAPAAGDYYLEARGFSEDAEGSYTLTITGGEIGNDANSSEALTANSEGRSSRIGVAGDVDWFSIQLVEGRPYRFNLEGAGADPLADPMLTLYDSEGNEVASDDDGGRGLNSYITFASTSGGTYYAAVSAFGDEGGTGDYTLRVSDTDVPASNSDEYLDAASDQRLSRIDMPGDIDSFGVELEAGVTYQIDVSGAGDNPLADPFLAVLDADGERVTSDDDSGDGLDARVRFTPEESGYFTIQASGLGRAVGWYQVTIERK